MGMLFEYSRDGDIDKATAQKVVAPISDVIVTLWAEAWSLWNTEISDVGRSKLTGRSRSSNVNDFAVDRAKDLLAGIDGVEMCPALGFFKIYLTSKHGKVVFRLKRLDHKRLARNVRSEQQIRYYNNEPVQGVKPGYTRLTAGYQLNPTETEIQDLLVTYQSSWRTLGWWFSVLPDADTRQFPIAPSSSPSPSPVPILPKKSQTKEGESA